MYLATLPPAVVLRLSILPLPRRGCVRQYDTSKEGSSFTHAARRLLKKNKNEKDKNTKGKSNTKENAKSQQFWDHRAGTCTSLRTGDSARPLKFVLRLDGCVRVLHIKPFVCVCPLITVPSSRRHLAQPLSVPIFQSLRDTRYLVHALSKGPADFLILFFFYSPSDNVQGVLHPADIVIINNNNNS